MSHDKLNYFIVVHHVCLISTIMNYWHFNIEWGCFSSSIKCHLRIYVELDIWICLLWAKIYLQACLVIVIDIFPIYFSSNMYRLAKKISPVTSPTHYELWCGPRLWSRQLWREKFKAYAKIGYNRIHQRKRGFLLCCKRGVLL